MSFGVKGVVCAICLGFHCETLKHEGDTFDSFGSQPGRRNMICRAQSHGCRGKNNARC